MGGEEGAEDADDRQADEINRLFVDDLADAAATAEKAPDPRRPWLALAVIKASSLAPADARAASLAQS
jgi:hypothetical protein